MKKVLKFIIIVYVCNLIQYFLFTLPLLKRGVDAGIIDPLAILPLGDLLHPIGNLGTAVGSGHIIVSLLTAVIILGWQGKKGGDFIAEIDRKSYIVIAMLLLVLTLIFVSTGGFAKLTG